MSQHIGRTGITLQTRVADPVVTLQTDDHERSMAGGTRDLCNVRQEQRGYACIHPRLSGELPLVTQDSSIVQASSTQAAYEESL